ARGGAATNGDTPASLVNSIRSKRNVAANSDGSLDSILKERGHELYWEGHRRQDLIRFGKYLDAWTAKGQSQAHRVLFPIPAIELAANPELDQNPGY
ncbi:MAG TPA: RagB/SusD family nutrient uptake outer membrane protein, partial [Saprospiraceae bacterium]|nr:RagB/SusD family nutrient uptake outer membrane protein [Saprospiraceae bacterium]